MKNSGAPLKKEANFVASSPRRVTALGERRISLAVNKNSARAAEGGAAVTAGGTTELHSRSGRAVFTRPCQLAALSGRRAAQDGQGTMPGGPERAEVKGSGGTLSAGRAAAPGSRVSAEGRGRSDDRVAHVLAERAKPGGSCGHGEAARASARARPFQAMARAVVFALAAVCFFAGPLMAADPVTTFVKPGDSGQIEYPIKHILDSAGPIDGLTLTVTAPAQFIVKATSIKGPFNTSPDETKTFVVDYEIAAGTPENPTPEGPFTVGFHFTATTPNVDPSLDTFETSVLFTTKPGRFSLDRLG